MAKIGLDIGHGKNTYPPSKGVTKNGKRYAEYDANSRVAKQLEAKLKSAGHTVYKAQPYNANDVPLATRTRNYFAQNVDLIVSLHANANGNSSANGYASFYWHNDSTAKKLSDLYADEIAKQGFKLWGGSRPSKPNDWSNFHMCRVPSQNGVPAILVENGFMTNAGDFEWIFGSKKDEYAEKCATAAFNAIQRFVGGTVETPSGKTAGESTNKPSKPSGNKSIDQLADEVIAGKHGSGDARKKALGSQYAAVQAKVNEKLGVKPKTNPKPAKKPASKSIEQLVKETLAGKHGNGEARKKALGADYQAVQDMINGKASAKGSASSKKGASSSSSVKVGQKVTATKLYATGNSTKNVRKSPITGTVDKIDNSWRNPIRLKNNSGQYIGFTRKQDLS